MLFFWRQHLSHTSEEGTVRAWCEPEHSLLGSHYGPGLLVPNRDSWEIVDGDLTYFTVTPSSECFISQKRSNALTQPFTGTINHFPHLQSVTLSIK